MKSVASGVAFSSAGVATTVRVHIADRYGNPRGAGELSDTVEVELLDVGGTSQGPATALLPAADGSGASREVP